ncbi:MAG: hypothetical protein AAGA46_14980 [Cyanobacteria bacterium P01_F01_bin.13]
MKNIPKIENAFQIKYFGFTFLASMHIPNKVYWLAYAFTSSIFILPVLILGIGSPTDLENLLKTGGVIESLPAIVNLLSAGLSILLTLKLAKTNKKFLFWGIYSVFCLFLAGEEASWGRDSVLGWQMISHSGDPTQSGDVHNLVSDALIASVPANTLLATVAIILLIAGLVIFKFKDFNQTLFKDWSNRSMGEHLLLKFITIGLVFLLLGMIDFIQEYFELSYLPGQWSIEELSELLGSIALLFAVMTRLSSLSYNKSEFIKSGSKWTIL